jgi:hypothetical protein
MGVDMNVMKKWILHTVFYASTAISLYVVIFLSLFLFSMVMLSNGVTFSNKIMNRYQRYVYFGGARRVWQHNPDCVSYDNDLLYKPKIGECTFADAEFHTTLNFDEHGRIHRNNSDKEGIAVIGDSFAMGYGVNDSETFAAYLEEIVDRPVYNLGVSSYGTYRELVRLEKSGLLNRIDTIVIQYCENDLLENIEKLSRNSSATREQFNSIFVASKRNTSRTLKSWAIEALWVPLSEAKALFVPHKQVHEDFAPHFEALTNVFNRFPWIRSKKVVLFVQNAHGRRFDNFEAFSTNSTGQPITFVDVNLGPEAYFIVDGHLNKFGHKRLAQIIGPIVSSSFNVTETHSQAVVPRH